MALSIRTYRSGDEHAINDAFNRVFGCHRSLEEWHWKYAEAGAKAATAAAWDGDRIAAHNGGIPADVEVGGRRVLALQGVDTFSLAAIERRREWKSAWIDVMDFFADVVAPEAGAPLLYGFTGGSKNISYMVNRCRWNSAEPRRIPLLKRQVTPTRGRSAVSRLYIARPASEVEPALDGLWVRVRNRYSSAVVRDTDHARRRFAGHPAAPYHRWLVRPRWTAKPVAFVIFRTDTDQCRWADLVWDGGHPGALDLIQFLSSRLAAQTGCTEEALWLDGDGRADAQLRAAGFDGDFDPSGVVRVTRFLDPALSAEAFASGSVYTTMADADLV